jgi:release factor glutamine methyltransferase
LDFEVNKHTLIPRPETELLVELATKEILQAKSYKLQPKAGPPMAEKTTIIDIGTGSGNIIISLAKNLSSRHPELNSESPRCRPTYDIGMTNLSFIAVDISKEALRIARRNIKRHKLEKKIKVIHSDLLIFFLEKKINSKSEILNSKNYKLIIVANLPYLSQEIYSATDPTVKRFEPRSALLSEKEGLYHYERLLEQIKEITNYGLLVTSYLEFSPEQKLPLQDLVKKIFPKARIRFHKDLSGRWRVVEIIL